jgi:hypothetical protein
MHKMDFGVMSLARKIDLTIAGVICAPAIPGKARHGLVEALSITLAFSALIAIILIRTK